MILVYEADGLNLLVSPVVFEAGSGIATLIGAVVEAHIKVFGATVFVGAAVVVSANEVRAVFAPWVLTPGDYTLHVRATPTGTAGQTIFDEAVLVKPSIKPRP